MSILRMRPSSINAPIFSKHKGHEVHKSFYFVSFVSLVFKFFEGMFYCGGYLTGKEAQRQVRLARVRRTLPNGTNLINEIRLLDGVMRVGLVRRTRESRIQSPEIL
jgi:hypothetical protein